MKNISNPDVAAVFESYPVAIRQKLMRLRKLIFDVAKSTSEAGPIEETLKWGESAYITSQSRSGSTIRIAWKKSAPDKYAMLFNCRTTLIESFRTVFPGTFTYEGNRAIVFDKKEDIPVKELAFCVGAALTYHLNKSKKR